jgi:hypothetical protein
MKKSTILLELDFEKAFDTFKWTFPLLALKWAFDNLYGTKTESYKLT